MATLFSILSWNIKHFRDSPARVQAVGGYLKKWKPDIFGLFEVEGKEVYPMMVTEFPQYALFITEGQQSQEILVACRKTFQSITFQQKREFDAGNPHLRPGALLSFIRNDQLCGALFLHTDSGTDAVGFGNRAEIFRHAFNLKRTIDKSQGNGRLIILGDLNTMGLQYPRQVKSQTRVESTMEIFNLEEEATKVKMTVLSKEEDATWLGSKGKSNLDHIIASTALKFTTYGAAAKPYQVRIDGWAKLAGAERTAYLKNISDHCLLYAKVTT
jgi:hypothetical protein